MTNEMIELAFIQMLEYYGEKKNMTLKKMAQKPLDTILTPDEYIMSRYMTRVLVASKMGLVDDIAILAGKKEWWPDDKFQEEYEKRWNYLYLKVNR